MQNSDSVTVVDRFYKAIDALIKQGTLRGKKTFCERYGINRWNFITQEKDLTRNIFQVSWLMYLVRDYGVSSEWLLTGSGSMFI